MASQLQVERVQLTGAKGLQVHKHKAWSSTKLHSLRAPCFAALASFDSKKETFPLQGKWAMKIQLGSHTFGATQQWSEIVQLYIGGPCFFKKPSSSYHLDGKHSIPYPIIWTHQHIAEIIDFIVWLTQMWFHVVSCEICHVNGLLLRAHNK